MFNINVILYNIMASLAVSYGNKYNLVKIRVEQIMKDSESRLDELAKARLSNSIDSEKMIDLLRDELYILESELAELAILTISEAQAAIDKVVTTFVSLIEGYASTQA